RGFVAGTESKISAVMLSNPPFFLMISHFYRHNRIAREIHYDISHEFRLHQQALQAFEQRFLKQNEIK
ncbi:MAG: hypothetical protein OSJ27_10820, partial [Candidatus Gastranaerophilales bacterium]|nr:hypothetical protein [Candidatus Gastranaerophilales bacterium]